MEPSRKQLHAEAQALERRGDVLAAAQAYDRAGAYEDAARLFLAKAHYAEAGKALLQGLGYTRHKSLSLDAAGRKVALKAAICFSKANDVRQAIELFLAAGEKARAVEYLQDLGDFVNAARVEKDNSGRVALVGFRDPAEEDQEAKTIEAARRLEQAGNYEAALQAYLRLKQWTPAAILARRLGRVDQAAGYYLEGGMSYEAAACFRELRESQRELESLVKIPPGDARYREACLRAIHIASDRAELTFEIEHFLGTFARGAPGSEEEVEAFYLLALLFETHEFPESAALCYRKILAVRPGYRDAQERLRAAETDYRGAAAKDYERVFKEELAFRDSLKRHETPIAGTPELGPDADGLGDLPDLPSLPPAPGPGMGRDVGLPDEAAVVGRARTMLSGPVHIAGRGGVTPAPVPVRAPAAAAPGAPGHGRAETPPVLLDPSSGGAAPTPAYPMAPSMRADGVVLPAALEWSGVTPAPVAQQVVLEPDAIVNQRYQLEKKIGQGGMGAVWKARDLELGEIIAIKFLSAQLVDEEALGRFRQEVSLSRQFNHPNIIRLYDIGTCGESKYISMELLSGHDLGKLMEEAPLDFDRGLAILVQACNALQIVHDRGVIHRDIKPDNFFITDEGVLKVMDFGIAKHHQAGRGLTRAGMMAGTPQYMAPEQANNFAGVTYLADLYALGCIAYQMFTGSVPFDGDEVMPILIAHMATPPEPPSSHNPNIPAEIEAVILKLLAKRPEQRVSSCRDLGAILSGIRLRLPPKPRVGLPQRP